MTAATQNRARMNVWLRDYPQQKKAIIVDHKRYCCKGHHGAPVDDVHRVTESKNPWKGYADAQWRNRGVKAPSSGKDITRILQRKTGTIGWDSVIVLYRSTIRRIIPKIQ